MAASRQYSAISVLVLISILIWPTDVFAENHAISERSIYDFEFRHNDAEELDFLWLSERELRLLDSHGQSYFVQLHSCSWALRYRELVISIENLCLHEGSTSKRELPMTLGNNSIDLIHHRPFWLTATSFFGHSNEIPGENNKLDHFYTISHIGELNISKDALAAAHFATIDRSQGDWIAGFQLYSASKQLASLNDKDNASKPNLGSHFYFVITTSTNPSRSFDVALYLPINNLDGEFVNFLVITNSGLVYLPGETPNSIFESSQANQVVVQRCIEREELFDFDSLFFRTMVIEGRKTRIYEQTVGNSLHRQPKSLRLLDKGGKRYYVQRIGKCNVALVYPDFEIQFNLCSPGLARQGVIVEFRDNDDQAKNYRDSLKDPSSDYTSGWRSFNATLTHLDPMRRFLKLRHRTDDQVEATLQGLAINGEPDETQRTAYFVTSQRTVPSGWLAVEPKPDRGTMRLYIPVFDSQGALQNVVAIQAVDGELSTPELLFSKGLSVDQSFKGLLKVLRDRHDLTI